MKLFKKVVLWVNIFCAALLLLSYTSPYIHPGTISLPALAGLLYPVLFIVNLVFTLLWVSFRKRYFWISLIAILIGIPFHGRFVQFSIDKKAVPDTAQSKLVVMTYNMHSLIDVPPYDRTKYAKKVKALSKIILEKVPGLDVLCSVEGAAGIEIGMKYAIKAKKANIFLNSKFPFKETGELMLEGQRHHFGVWADIQTPMGITRVYNVHLQTNKITQETEELMDHLRVQEKDTWIRVGDVLSKYQKASAIRSDQAYVLKNHIENSPFPVVVCGDFNDTPQSNAYQIIQKDLIDTFKARGKGIGTTYAGSLPALRIDYILLSPTLTPISHQIPEWKYSDHYPIIVTLHNN